MSDNSSSSLKPATMDNVLIVSLFGKLGRAEIVVWSDRQLDLGEPKVQATCFVQL